MSKPRLLDLFCGAGGAAMGYHRAGFEVVGVDIKPQKNFPFEFHQADALDYPLDGFDAYHASPPCQFASQATLPWRAKGRIYENLIPQTRELFIEAGKPFVIENVGRARKYLCHPILLCGSMFGLRTYRHRLFEISIDTPLILHPGHGIRQGQLRGPADGRAAYMIQVVGHSSFAGENALRKTAMDIDWMKPDELTQAIPPAYTEYIGKYLLDEINRSQGER